MRLNHRHQKILIGNNNGQARKRRKQRSKNSPRRPRSVWGCSLLPVEGGILPYFIETKSDKGRQTPAQLQFEEKVEACGCLYELIRDVKDMRVTVERITQFNKRKLESIELF